MPTAKPTLTGDSRRASLGKTVNSAHGLLEAASAECSAASIQPKRRVPTAKPTRLLLRAIPAEPALAKWPKIVRMAPTAAEGQSHSLGKMGNISRVFAKERLSLYFKKEEFLLVKERRSPVIVNLLRSFSPYFIASKSRRVFVFVCQTRQFLPTLARVLFYNSMRIVVSCVCLFCFVLSPKA
jgi:hypothetical protein